MAGRGRGCPKAEQFAHAGASDIVSWGDRFVIGGAQNGRPVIWISGPPPGATETPNVTHTASGISRAAQASATPSSDFLMLVCRKRRTSRRCRQAQALRSTPRRPLRLRAHLAGPDPRLDGAGSRRSAGETSLVVGVPDKPGEQPRSSSGFSSERSWGWEEFLFSGCRWHGCPCRRAAEAGVSSMSCSVRRAKPNPIPLPKRGRGAAGAARVDRCALRRSVRARLRGGGPGPSPPARAPRLGRDLGGNAPPPDGRPTRFAQGGPRALFEGLSLTARIEETSPAWGHVYSRAAVSEAYVEVFSSSPGWGPRDVPTAVCDQQQARRTSGSGSIAGRCVDLSWPDAGALRFIVSLFASRYVWRHRGRASRSPYNDLTVRVNRKIIDLLSPHRRQRTCQRRP